MQNLDTLLVGLRAASEHTRLRILALCASSELSVSELVQILGQSQPRVSRHLKLMVEAGLLERIPEGAQVFLEAHMVTGVLYDIGVPQSGFFEHGSNPFPGILKFCSRVFRNSTFLTRTNYSRAKQQLISICCF